MSPQDWDAIGDALDADGVATVRGVLDAQACEAIVSGYAQAELYRSRVIMQRHGFGRGEYQYYRYPLPDTVQRLRETWYAGLAPIANDWGTVLGDPRRYPATHAEYSAQCRAAGQQRPTPLQLKYTAGDYNCLHQDLYGEHLFPLQMVVLLSEPGRDFDGGELVLVEQRPRMQSRPLVLHLGQGDAAVFAVNQRPVHGARGPYRVKMKHGVSRVTRGERHALGVILHDAA